MNYKLSPEIKHLVTNVAFSGFGQFVTLASPLLITPYLIRIVGIEKFGVIALAQSVVMYISFFTDYSFNIDATQEASINRHNYPQLISIFSTVFWSKLFLSIIGLVVFLTMVSIVPVFKLHYQLFILSYVIVVGKILLPQWLLIGIERVKDYTTLIIISKLIVYVLVLLLIKDSRDYVYVNLIWGCGDLFISPFIYFFLLRNIGISVILRPSFTSIIKRLRSGWSLFASNFMNNIYIYSNLTILSLFAPPHILGAYAVAEKIILLIKHLAGIITQTTYPYICRLALESNQHLINFLRKETYLFIAIFLSIAIGLLLFSDPVIKLFTSKSDLATITLLKWMAFIPLIVSLNMSASQIMLVYKIRKPYFQVLTLSCIVNIAGNFLFTPLFLATGTILAIYLTEITCTIGIHVRLWLSHPQLRIFSFQSIRGLSR